LITSDLDDAAVLALNNAHARETSTLTPAGLAALRAEAFVAAGVARGADAFLIALVETAASDSPNFAWFKARFDRFAYVDRVITAPHARGRGLARALYEHLFAHTAATGRSLIVCEVNAEPPNPASDAFHAALGFEFLERCAVPAQHKVVSYLVKRLDHDELTQLARHARTGTAS
jgi:predicted GNAT superfamily acetyltransferase